MKLRMILEPSDEGGYTAIVPALPGYINEGKTQEEALANIQEAIELYLEPVEDDFEFGPDAEVREKAMGGHAILLLFGKRQWGDVGAKRA